jgi:hypothetical protein
MDLTLVLKLMELNATEISRNPQWDKNNRTSKGGWPIKIRSMVHITGICRTKKNIWLGFAIRSNNCLCSFKKNGLCKFLPYTTKVTLAHSSWNSNTENILFWFAWLNLQAYTVCFQNLIDLSFPQLTKIGSTGEWSSHLGAPVLPEGNLVTFSAVSASQTTTWRVTYHS